jgi:DNA-directed RNA polymerase specialized sigma24 family protein
LLRLAVIAEDVVDLPPRESERRQVRRPLIEQLAGKPGRCSAGDSEFTVYLGAVQRAFDWLSEEQREILLLVAVEELTYEEAAAVLNVPIGTVRSRLSRARAALRSHMEAGSGSEDREKGSCVQTSGGRRQGSWSVPH